MCLNKDLHKTTGEIIITSTSNKVKTFKPLVEEVLTEDGLI